MTQCMSQNVLTTKALLLRALSTSQLKLHENVFARKSVFCVDGDYANVFGLRRHGTINLNGLK
jgi:hypothetical protein